MFTTYSPVQVQALNPELYNALPPSLRSVPGTTATIPDLLQLPINGNLRMGLGSDSWPPIYRQDELSNDDHLRLYIQDSWRVRPVLVITSIDGNRILLPDAPLPQYVAH
jgi:hypothetical protein